MRARRQDSISDLLGQGHARGTSADAVGTFVQEIGSYHEGAEEDARDLDRVDVAVDNARGIVHKDAVDPKSVCRRHRVE